MQSASIDLGLSMKENAQLQLRSYMNRTHIIVTSQSLLNPL